MACPFSLRAPPKSLGDYTFDNNFAIVNMNLRLVNSLKDGLSAINRDMHAIKKSFEPFGSYYLTKVAMFMPEFLRRKILNLGSEKMTFGYSNVPGPKRPFTIAGKVNNGIGFIMPVGGDLTGSFSIISHVNVVKIIIMMDKATMPDVKVLSDIFIANMNEMFGGPAW